MERRIKFSAGEYYHLYNRGVEKRSIFSETDDWKRFQRLLYLSNGDNPTDYRDTVGINFADISRGKPLVAIGCYVMMPNHFHILVKEITDGGISKFMSKFVTAYSMYFNKKYERIGPLFQGRFKAEHAGKDNYLKYLFAYIHLNPVKLIQPSWREEGIKNKAGVLEYLKQYDYSSYPDYLGSNRESGLILEKSEFPEYFSKESDFTSEMGKWLQIDKVR